jgi:hypothetical protein
VYIVKGAKFEVRASSKFLLASLFSAACVPGRTAAMAASGQLLIVIDMQVTLCKTSGIVCVERNLPVLFPSSATE